VFYPYNNNLVFPQFQQPQIQVQQQSNIPVMQFVQNKDSVTQFQTPNNCSTVYFDQNKTKFYVKTTNASGSANIKAFSYTEDTEETEETEQFVSKTEFEQLKQQMEEMRNILNERNADVNRNERNDRDRNCKR
jgi:hypothetical protein